MRSKLPELSKNGILTNRSRAQWVAYLFLLPAIIAFLVSKYLPISEGIFISFFEIDIVNLPGKFVGFDNYIRAFKDPQFYKAIGHNFKFFAYGMVFGFWPPILVAILINEVRKGKTLFRMGYFIPAIAPGIAMIILWKYFWQPDYGLANYLIGLFGMEPQMWLNDEKLVYFCMSFPGIVITGGMNMLIFLAALQDVPAEQYEAAMLEGAGFFKRTWHISLPVIKNVIGIMFILTVIGCFNTMEGPMIFTGGGPAGSTETALLYAYKQATNRLDYSYSITMSNIVFFLVLIGTALQMKFSKKED
ncbi:MAG: sugar ABC transporter permease [Oscillospiraceae bacterium]